MVIRLNSRTIWISLLGMVCVFVIGLVFVPGSDSRISPKPDREHSESEPLSRDVVVPPIHVHLIQRVGYLEPSIHPSR